MQTKEDKNYLGELSKKKKTTNLNKKVHINYIDISGKIKNKNINIDINKKNNVKSKEMQTKEEKKIRIPIIRKDNKPKIVKLLIVKQQMKDTPYKKDNIKKLEDNYKKKTTNLNKNVHMNYFTIRRKINKQTNVISSFTPQQVL